MMLPIVFLALGLLANIQQTSAECANACNGHGKCTSYDMCICNRNWQAADCSERVCMFGLAHVDTPKGDLDASGGLSNADKLVIDNNYVYPYGTTEQFPQMQDSDLQAISDSAHYYMECSNKGRCDRSTGECQCFDGYDGVACQRASCPGYPNSCSGHGICKTIQQLAESDHGNVYKLWDKDVTMGCECDAGYFGADCSQRECKYGVDPLYLDDAATVKYSIFDFATLSTKTGMSAGLSGLFTNGEYDAKTAYWAIRFYDLHNEDWVTEPIAAGASCSEVTAALEALPNNVIPSGSLQCTRVEFVDGLQSTYTQANKFYDAQHSTYRIYYQMALWEAQTATNMGEFSPFSAISNYTNSNQTTTTALSGHIYRIKFYGNPGALPQPDIEVNLDGKRPTLISTDSKVITKVWTDGQQGENNDYFADHCDGVTVTIGRHISLSGAKLSQSFLNGMTDAEKNLLKKCLGDSDLDTTNNVDVYNWDHGSFYFPHIIKLVRTVTTYTDGGYYAVVWYDTSYFWDSTGSGGTFRLLNPFMPPDAMLTDNYDVYTTKGTLALTSSTSQAVFSFGSRRVYSANVDFDMNTYDYDGDISCEVGANNAGKFTYIESSGSVYHCLNKTDMFTILNWERPELNPPHINLYTAQRLMTEPYTHSVKDKFAGSGQPDAEMHFMTHSIDTDLSTNWGISVGKKLYPSGLDDNGVQYRVYKFIPASKSTYEYVSECSNRGICDRESAVCKCFPGYTSDACSEQSSLSV